MGEVTPIGPHASRAAANRVADSVEALALEMYRKLVTEPGDAAIAAGLAWSELRHAAERLRAWGHYWAGDAADPPSAPARQPRRAIGGA